MVIAAVVVQLLVQFGVLDTRNRFVWAVADFLYKMTEPLFRRMRRYMPDLGSVDLSPLVVILLLVILLVATGFICWRNGGVARCSPRSGRGPARPPPLKASEVRDLLGDNDDESTLSYL